MERQRKYLRMFFKADQVTFLFSMFVVLLYLVSSLPRCSVEDELAEAAQVWLGYLVASLLLGVAIVAGMAAFVFAAYAVYPPELVEADVRPFWVLTIAVVAGPVSVKWASTLWHLRPGVTALGRYFGSWFNWRSELRIPLQGADESANQILQEMQTAATRSEEQRQAQGAEQRRLAQEAEARAEKRAAEQKAQTEQLLQEQRAQTDKQMVEQRAWAEQLLQEQKVQTEHLLQEQKIQTEQLLQEQRAQAAEQRAGMQAQLEVLRALLQAQPGAAHAAPAAPAEAASRPVQAVSAEPAVVARGRHDGTK